MSPNGRHGSICVVVGENHRSGSLMVDYFLAFFQHTPLLGVKSVNLPSEYTKPY